MFGRTMSYQTLHDDSEIIKAFLTKVHEDIEFRKTSGELTEIQAQTIHTTINEYVKFNAEKTTMGFKKGLMALIEHHLSEIQTHRPRNC